MNLIIIFHYFRMLLKKLFQYLPMTESQALQSSAALKSLAANFHGNLPPTVLGPVQPSGQTTTQYAKKKKNSKANANKKKKDMISKQGYLKLLKNFSEKRAIFCHFACPLCNNI